MLKSYYEILNITPNASKDEITKQFKKLAKMYHPDINSSLEAEEIFKQINKAAQILLDDEKRKNYDALRNVNKEIYKSQKIYKNHSSSNYTFSDLFSKLVLLFFCSSFLFCFSACFCSIIFNKSCYIIIFFKKFQKRLYKIYFTYYMCIFIFQIC